MAETNGYHPLRGKRRTLSPFLAEEMMYDYVADCLDDGRKTAIKEFLKKSKEAQELESHLRSAIAYCDQLSETALSEPLMQKLVHSKSLWNRTIDFVAWKKWPEAARWTLEAFAVSLVVAFVVALSWPKVSQWFPERKRDVVLAEVDKPSSEKETPRIDAENEGSAASDVLELAKNSQENSKTSLQTPVPKNDNSKKAAAAEIEKPQPEDRNSKSSNTEVLVPSEDGTQNESQESTKVVAKETEVAKPVVEKPTPKGFVYRAFMALGGIESVTEDIRGQLMELGGQKAGEVRMGWRKPKGSYFHFSVPEANYDAVVEMLRSFGPVQIAKDPHWRVMPEGKIRIILWVEDSDLKNKNP